MAGKQNGSAWALPAGAPGPTRTANLRVRSAVLCPLSYEGVCPLILADVRRGV